MFVYAYVKATGKVVRVPESHLRIFPDVLSKTPRQKAKETGAARAASQAVKAATAEGSPEANMKE